MYDLQTSIFCDLRSFSTVYLIHSSRNKVTQYRYPICSTLTPKELLSHIVGVCPASQRSTHGEIRILFLILSHNRLSLSNGRGWPVSSWWRVVSIYNYPIASRESQKLYKAIPYGHLSSQLDLTKHNSYEFMRELCQR